MPCSPQPRDPSVKHSTVYETVYVPHEQTNLTSCHPQKAILQSEQLK